MSGSVGLAAAFAAGLASFLSPCVLPLVPGYLSFLGGVSTREEGGVDRSRSRLLLHAVLFVAGFTFVFVALGATASALGSLLAPYRDILSRAAGAVVVVFGFLMLGVVQVPWLSREFRFDPARARKAGMWAAPVMGAAFAFGWTPCVGPVLGSILTLAGQGGSVSGATALLFAYSLGLGVPFIVFAFALGRLTPVLRFLARYSRAVSVLAGIVLMALGLAMLTGQLERIVALLT